MTVRELTPEYTLTREEALKALVSVLPPDAVLVGTTGKASRELYEIRVAEQRDPQRDFLTVGAMGHASQIAAGIALARPDRKVVCIDGDGALIMHMGGLTTTATFSNLLHIIINNGSHESVGGQPTRIAHRHPDYRRSLRLCYRADCCRRCPDSRCRQGCSVSARVGTDRNPNPLRRSDGPRPSEGYSGRVQAKLHAFTFRQGMTPTHGRQ